MSGITDKQYKFFADLIYKKTGNVYQEANYYRLDGRLRDLRENYKVETVEELVNVFSTGATQVDFDKLISSATNNETFFFRDKKPFRALREQIINELLEVRSVKMLRFWSAPSSTGQEVYSIIMTMMENFPDIPFTVDASDISEDALAKAKKGIYTQLEVQRGLPASYLVKYFDQLEDKSWQVKNEVRIKATFKSINLLEDIFEADKYDVIFCRNVMIYFNVESRQNLINKLERSLRSQGKLILGSGESVIGIETRLQQKFYGDLLAFEKE